MHEIRPRQPATELSGVANRIIIGLTIAIVVASFAVSAAFRDKHFQELDSYMVAEFFMDPRGSVLDYALFGYGVRRQAPETGAITAMLRASPDFALRLVAGTTQFERYRRRVEGGPSLQEPEQVRAFLLRTAAREPRVASLSAHSLYRLALFTGLSAVPLPALLRDGLMFPLASTYSVGPGLIYSGLWQTGPSPLVFMSRATLLTLAVFHLAVLALFAALLRAGLPVGASAIAAVWLLFATTPFSYGFHLGSAVWMMAASAVFLLVVVSSNDISRRARRVALATASLVFVSYLAVVYYAAFLMTDAAARLASRGDRRVRDVVSDGLRDHWPAAVGILACAVLFYEPGQGARGGMESLGEVGIYLTYIPLNLFGIAWGNAPAPGSIQILAQAAVVWAVLGLGVWAAGRAAVGPEASTRFIARMLGALLLIYVVMVAAGLLAPAPTRHMLFLAPALYVLAAFGLMQLGRVLGRPVASRRRAAAAVTPVLILVFASLGLLAQQARFERIRAAGLDARPAGAFAGLLGDAAPVGWRLGLSHLRVADLRRLHGSILYADSACDLACFVHQHSTDPGFEIRGVTPLGTYSSMAKMVAFVPPLDEARFPFDRRNRVYLGRLDVAPRRADDAR